VRPRPCCRHRLDLARVQPLEQLVLQRALDGIAQVGHVAGDRLARALEAYAGFLHVRHVARVVAVLADDGEVDVSTRSGPSSIDEAEIGGSPAKLPQRLVFC
jgi:hypothetical protein